MELDEQIAWLEDQLRTALETIAFGGKPTPSEKARARELLDGQIDAVLAS